MTKAEAIADPNSCWNRALDDEPVFILLGRDIAATDAIYRWIFSRIERFKNVQGDAQLVEAYASIGSMLAFSEKVKCGIVSIPAHK